MSDSRSDNVFKAPSSCRWSESLAKSIRTIYNIKTTVEFQVIISKDMANILS